jgi:hypothetical protein
LENFPANPFPLSRQFNRRYDDLVTSFDSTTVKVTSVGHVLSNIGAFPLLGNVVRFLSRRRTRLGLGL